MFLVAQVAEELVSRVGELRHVDCKHDELAHAFFYIGFRIEFCTRLSRAAHRDTQQKLESQQNSRMRIFLGPGLRFEEHLNGRKPHPKGRTILTSEDRETWG